MKHLYAGILCICSSFLASAQCPVGQMNVQVEVVTFSAGFETYLQIIPTGNECGTGVIWEGGNIDQVGCTGGGENDATPGYGYTDFNDSITDAGCLDYGTYDLIYIDDFGDGLSDFDVWLDGYDVYHFEGIGAESRYTFDVAPIPEFDAGVIASSTLLYTQPGDITISGVIFNSGTDTIESIDVNYSVDGGSTTTSTLTGLHIVPFTEYNYVNPIPWTATSNGNYTIAQSTGLINGSPDEVASNDMFEKEIVINDPIPNVIDDYVNFAFQEELIADWENGLDMPVDLDFYPVLSDYELWIVNRGLPLIGGSTVTLFHAGQPDQSAWYYYESWNGHFLDMPTSIAFSENGNWSNGTGVQDDNHGGGIFTGPTLWSSDTSIYGHEWGGLGNHLDMLHETPFTMGIAADHANAFWAFCDYYGYIYYYDFQHDHGPGNEDHTDGIVNRYEDFTVAMQYSTLPCHMVLDANKEWLYIVDGGNSRIIRMNTNTGSVTGTWTSSVETLQESNIITGTDWEVLVSEGLNEPTGIDVIDNYMLVSDYATNEIIIYDISTVPAVELKRLYTNLEGIMGIKIGPDGMIWAVDEVQNELIRLNTTNILATDESLMSVDFQIFPNPSDGNFTIRFDNFEQYQNADLAIYDELGRVVYEISDIDGNTLNIDISNLPAGSYRCRLNTAGGAVVKQIFIVK